MALSESPRLGFDPFAELRRMQGEMNRVFSGFNATAARDFPPINIWLGGTYDTSRCIDRHDCLGAGVSLV